MTRGVSNEQIHLLNFTNEFRWTSQLLFIPIPKNVHLWQEVATQRKKKKENNDITLQKVISFTIPEVALLPEVVTELI